MFKNSVTHVEDAKLTMGDATGYTALHYASFDRNPRLVSVLLATGTDPNVMSTDGHTPLVAAESQKHGFRWEQLLSS